MKVQFELDWFSWNIGIAICRSKTNNRLCYLITIFPIGILFMPFERSLKWEI